MENTIKSTEPWKKLKLLGSGGFGQVTLWYNSVTGQKIAVKKLHEHALKDLTVKNKQTERWCNEVEIMKKLNHVNIVATMEVPPEINIITQLPILAMEYCSEGDLRQVLNKPENCCGLREPEILDILRDVSNGLAYLHSCKIIHRDLKPDNIVLQKKESRIIYKLIDLGYAKSLDQSSLSKSFVGTIQYIAPELFMGKAYTSSVDYWSFGLLTHEIITGYRPFLPGYSPSDWMKQIQNKSRNIICVLENNNGDVVFSSNISRKNHLSSCFLEDIEVWLRLALDWDGQTRGRDLQRNRPVIFEELGNILCKKVIKVFSLPTYETLTYEVTAETEMSQLREWLERDTNLEVDDQLLLLPDGVALNSEGNILNCLKNEKLDRKSISIFLYNSGVIKLKNKAKTGRPFVEELLNSSSPLLSYRKLKRICAESVYFIQSEAIRSRNFFQGIRVKINNTKQKTSAIESLYEDIGEEWTQIENYGQFLSFSHKIDLENYIYFRKNGKLKSSVYVKKWIQNVIDVNNKITELKNSYNKSEQRQLVLLARQRCRILENYPGAESVQKTPLDDLVIKGQALWEALHNLPKENRENLLSNSNLINLVNLTAEESKKVLNSQMVVSLFQKISEADENLAKFLSHLTTLLKSLRILKLVIENTQKERQKEVWNLISNVKPQEEKLNEEVNENPTKIDGEKEVQKPQNGKTIFQKEKMTDSVISSKSDFEGLNYPDTYSVIDDNNYLRYRIQEIQLTCHQMVDEMNSLNWDSAFETKE